MAIDINKHEVDIDTLFKQNENDLSSIKELYRNLKELEKKIIQIKYIDSNLADKLKKDYEKLKRVILDENIQAKLTNDIKEIDEQLTKIRDINGKKIYQFSNVESMKTYNVKVNEVCETLGYYSTNDGGGCKYLVETQSKGLGSVVLLNGLYANIVFDNDKRINVLKLEVSKKLDEMVEDGTIKSIINEVIDERYN